MRQCPVQLQGAFADGHARMAVFHRRIRYLQFFKYQRYLFLKPIQTLPDLCKLLLLIVRNAGILHNNLPPLIQSTLKVVSVRLPVRTCRFLKKRLRPIEEFGMGDGMGIKHMATIIDIDRHVGGKR